MNKSVRSRKFSAKQSARLGAYFVAGVGASITVASSSEAAIVNIDIGPSGFNIGGINGGVASGSFTTVHNFPFAGAGYIKILNIPSAGRFGIDPWAGFEIAINPSAPSGSRPRNFALNYSIGPSVGSFSASSSETRFRDFPNVSPDFGPNSYMGFKTATGNYGWLEVTWTAASNQFQILSGAYENQVGAAILAGNTGGPAAVPEPGTWATAALLMGGATYLGWRRRRDEAQKEAA